MQPMSDSAELLMLSSIFADLEDGETRTENIKRRIDLMWKFIKNYEKIQINRLQTLKNLL